MASNLKIDLLRVVFGLLAIAIIAILDLIILYNLKSLLGLYFIYLTTTLLGVSALWLIHRFVQSNDDKLEYQLSKQRDILRNLEKTKDKLEKKLIEEELAEKAAAVVDVLGSNGINKDVYSESSFGIRLIKIEDYEIKYKVEVYVNKQPVLQCKVLRGGDDRRYDVEKYVSGTWKKHLNKLAKQVKHIKDSIYAEEQKRMIAELKQRLGTK